jgi:NDP-sugar pyrophosphorylase family protein
MKAVVLAGGKGARLAPYTKILPKPLMPIGDMPILEILLRQMKRAGVNEVIITVGHLAGLLRAFFQGGSELGLNITYSYEDTPLGTAGPLSLVEGLDKTFLVSNGDVLTTLDMKDLLRFHFEQKAAATIAVHLRKVDINYGVIESDKNHQIVGYIEKPSIDYMVSMGIYVFEPKALEYIPYSQYLDLPDLVKNMLAAGEKVMCYPFNGYWQDLGRPDDYECATRDFDAMRVQFLPED